MPRKPTAKPPKAPSTSKPYRHPEADAALRPEVGTQAQFKQRKPPTTYRFDSALAPELQWDDHSARELGEWVLGVIEELATSSTVTLSDSEGSRRPDRPDSSRKGGAQSDRGVAGDSKLFEFKNARGEVTHTLRTLPEALALLKRLSRPFLNWAGKAERLSFDVPTLPLFIHERLSTAAILETLKGHKRDKQMGMFELFGDPQRSLRDQLLRAYEHVNNWSNRLILGDSLVVMNSLLRYEGLGGQVQMIYMDPPYGVKFGSNFQPFVRKRDVSQSDDADMTREPEMVKAYRDTWELGLHSYLTYMRDRLLLSRDLLTPSGSIFVQISDENVHHVRELMDDVFGAENFSGLIPFKKTGGQSSKGLPAVVDYLIWYAKSKEQAKYRQIFVEKIPGQEGATNYTWIEEANGNRRPLTADEIRNWSLPPNCRIFQPYPLFSEGVSPGDEPFEWKGQTYKPSATSHWKTTKSGLNRLESVS